MRIGLLTVVYLVLLVLRAAAGGSGFNVVVVVNQLSSNSVALGNYYCEQRQVPPQNLWRMTNWNGGNVQWSIIDLNNALAFPLHAMLADRQLTSQIDYVVLSMDIPYRVIAGSSANSTTSVLYYGLKLDTTAPLPTLPDSCSLPPDSQNSYAFTEMPFRSAPPDTALTNSYLVTMITATDLAAAQRVVDQGVASDSTFPTQTVILAKSSDPYRNVRFMEFDNTIFDMRLHGGYSLRRANEDLSTTDTNLLGYQTGLANYAVAPNAFVPGAIADTLTSFGGFLFDYQLYGQSPLWLFLNAGAVASYGTVVEPCGYLEKFPSPLDYFYQARGFSLAECYYQSVLNPHQGLMVGEPLAAPFARRGGGTWSNLPPNAVLTGTTNLSLTFAAADASRPLQQVDLFVDGAFLRTLTNVPPAAGNQLTVSLNNTTINYRVPTNATVSSISSGLADQINALSNATEVVATAFGDRIELHSTNLYTLGGAIPLTAITSAGTAPRLTSFVSSSLPQFLDTTAYPAAYLAVSNTPIVGDWLTLQIIKTNGQTFSFSATNSATNGTVSDLVQTVTDQAKANLALQEPDGVSIEDVVGYDAGGVPEASFTVRAQTIGPPLAQVLAILQASTNLLLLPGPTNHLDANLGDVLPRNHLYITAGVTNLLLPFVLDTTALPDGYHELTAIAYEGGSVRTQTRTTQSVIIKNTPLTATLTSLLGNDPAAVEGIFPFTVAASATNVATIELFSTGGSLGVVSNQPTATFPVAGTNLGLGLHPFYALLTTANGTQYRTATTFLRLIGAQPPFKLQLAGFPPHLTWPAIPGRRYDVLATANLVNAFQPKASLVATSNTGQWTDTNATVSSMFYRVRFAP